MERIYAARIKILKTASGLSTQEIIDKSGVSKSTVNRFLAGDIDNMAVSYVRACLVAMGYEMSDLFVGKLEGCQAHLVSDKALSLAEKTIEMLTKNNKRMMIFCMGLSAVICMVLLIDLLMPSVGWVRYALEHLRDLWQFSGRI